MSEPTFTMDQPTAGQEPEKQTPPTPVDIAQAEYCYWRQFIDHEDSHTSANAIGGIGAAANIVGGLMRKQIMPKDDNPIENMALIKRRMYASETILISGALQYMLNELRSQLSAKEFAASTSPVLAQKHAAAGAFKEAGDLFDAFEAKLNTVLLLLPAPVATKANLEP